MLKSFWSDPPIFFFSIAGCLPECVFSFCTTKSSSLLHHTCVNAKENKANLLILAHNKSQVQNNTGFDEIYKFSIFFWGPIVATRWPKKIKI